MRCYITTAAVWLAMMPFVAGAVGFVSLWGLHVWNPPLWLAIAVGGVVWSVAMFVAWRLSSGWVKNGFRFSLRKLLLAMGVIAIYLATVGRWWLGFFGQHSAIQSVGRYGSYVEDDLTMRARRRVVIHEWFGFDPFENNRTLCLRSDFGVSELLAHPQSFSDFAALSFERGVTSAAFFEAHRLDGLHNARTGEFMSSLIDEPGLHDLTNWKSVNHLFFNGCPNVTDAGLAHFVDMPQLKKLGLVEEGGGMVITDAGLAHIGKMRQLTLLRLFNFPKITDVGLADLHSLQNLETLWFHGTSITPAGLQAFYAAVPDCRVITDVVVDGPQNVSRIVVRAADQGHRVAAEIEDLDRIAQILNWTSTVEARGGYDFYDSPREARYSLEFNGRSRVLYECRFDEKLLEYQKPFAVRWTHWQLTADDARELMSLVLAESPKKSVQ